MKISAKGIFIGLAGLAAVSGAGYYLYKKNYYYTPKNGNEQLLYLRQIIFEKQRVPYERILNTFNQSQNYFIGKHILELSKRNQDQEPILSRICRKNLTSAYFYECLDCSTTIKNNKYDNIDKENMNQYSHQICEDCFDHEIHKGHSYKLIKPYIEGFCDCGFSFLVNEKSFCSKHSGFSAVKVEFDRLVSDEVKNSITQYYKELFYILIDGQSDLIYQSFKKEKKELEEIMNQSTLFDKFNSFFGMILESIQQTNDSYHPFVYCFVELIKSTFTKPTRINSSIDQFKLNDSKNVDNTETIFGYLLKYQTYMNEKSTSVFNDILQILCHADNTLNAFIFGEYARLINFSIKKGELKEGNRTFKIFTQSKLYGICISAFGNQDIIHNLYIKNEQILINLLLRLKEMMANMEFLNEEEISIPSSLLSMINSIFDSPEILNEFTRTEELFELIVDVLQIIFNRILLITNPNEDIVQTIIFKAGFYLSALGISSFIYELMFKVVVLCQKQLLSKEKKEIILSTISNKFQLSINTFSQVMLKDQTTINYLGVSLCPLLIVITILSEGINLSSNDVINAMKKNLDFKDDSEMNKFIGVLLEILSNNILNYCFNQKGTLLLHLTQFLSQTEYAGINEGLWMCQTNAEFLIYDSQILVFQLLTSVQSKEQNMCKQFIEKFSANALSSLPLLIVFLTKPQNLINQIYFDQTPLLNLDKKLQNILSQGNEQIKEKFVYATKQVINNLLKWLPNKCQSYQQFLDLIKVTLIDTKLVKEILPLFGEIDEKNDTIDLKPLEDLENTSMNLGRYLNNITNKELTLPTSFSQFASCKEGLIPHLYEYQQKSLIHNFSDHSLFQLLRKKVQSLPKQGQNSLIQITDGFLIIWNYLISLTDNNSEIVLNEEEKKAILLLKEEIYSIESIFLFNPILAATTDEQIKKFQGIQSFKKLYSQLAQEQNIQQNLQQPSQS